MNIEIEVLQRVATLFGISYLLSMFVTHAVEVARKFAPKREDGASKLDGWLVPAVALLFSVLVALLILRPTTVDAGYDSATVALFSALGAVGGDVWVKKMMGLLSKPTSAWREESPTKPEGRIL
jgi:hypothetical protein